MNGSDADAATHRGGKEAAGLELLQRHGAGVSPEEEDEGHQGDVRHVAAGLAHQLTSVPQAVVLAQGLPAGAVRQLLRWKGARERTRVSCKSNKN